MAFGFGFNKAKILSVAEKFVQQGKMQNAIAEYEKVTKEDPKDLTVLNTIGDLYSRIGNAEKAVECFQLVGEAYASDGFTVKAIAMYKKLTKSAPQAMEHVQRLAELYTIQGLYNDARSQYVHVADSCLRNQDNDGAARIFQKILELDPDNTAMQQKLADLYIKLGKKTEARNIYFTAAQSLYAKQAMDSADEALERVLKIDPKNVDALLLRGTIAAESGDGAAALSYLKEIPDIDSRPEGLRSLLRAFLQQKNLEEAAPVASKLINVHNDMSGVSWYADALLTAEKYPEALQVYEQHADKLLSSGGPSLMKALTATINRVKDSTSALESLRKLFHKAGDNSHDAEVMELQAHAFVQEGNLHKARDLYQQLAESEPENPLHGQNYKQVIARLGEDAATIPLTAEQAAQAIMMEDMDLKPSAIQQDYPADIAAAVQQALTDSELFESYNLPAKSLAPLEAGLIKAPRDVQINQRLVSFYAKTKRYQDAARCCMVLKEVHAEKGFATEAQKYGAMASQYQSIETGAPVTAKIAAMQETAAATMISLESTAQADTPAFMASSVGEVNFDAAPIVTPRPAAIPPPPPAAPPAVAASADAGIDDWESMLSVEEPAAPTADISMEVTAEAAPAADFQIEVAPPVAEPVVMDLTPAPFESAPAADLSFDVAPAEIVVEPPSIAPVIELSAEVPAPVAAEATAAFEIPLTAEPSVSFEMPVVEEPAPPPIVEAPPAPVPTPRVQPVAPLKITPPPPKAAPPPKVAPPPEPEPVAVSASGELDLLGDLASDLDQALGDDFTFGGAAAAPVTAPPPKAAAAVSASAAPATLPTPVAPESVPVGFSSMGHELESAQPVIENQEATSMLSDLFAEFKEDAEESAGEAEDPDTHYSLGIAFKEMGLLDEAIGELQKVCHAIDRGHPFTQTMQAYTWLAQCLVDKGAPAAAIRWYEKALKAPDLHEDSRLAIYYDIGNAYEADGNKKKAFDAFMEVFSSNIDYRDIADRIKSLKS